MKTAVKNALRTGGILMGFALAGTALLALTYDHTRPVIARSQEAEKRALVSQVMPAKHYDNDLLASVRTLPPDPLLGTRQASSAWIARREGTYAGVVLEAFAPDGYSGEIALLIGIDAKGRITAVRVTAHRETPGLGDYIDRSRSDWVDQFTNKALLSPPNRGWSVKKDGGVFDARAGATISPRAVVKAVKRALDYHARHRAAFAAQETPQP